MARIRFFCSPLLFCCLALTSPETLSSECFEVTISVNTTKADGNSWDIKNNAPDVYACISEKDSYTCKGGEIGSPKAYCTDSYECNIGIIRIEKTNFQLKIMDDDELRDDPIDYGECNTSERCVLGNAIASFKNVKCD